ncbi:DNA packaging protein [Clostridium botulinum]
MIVTLEEVVQYVRLDSVEDLEEDEKNQLQLLIKNAEFYIEDASISISGMSDRTKEKAKLLALVLISDWYDNRSYNMKTSEKARDIVRSLLTQILYCR